MKLLVHGQMLLLISQHFDGVVWTQGRTLSRVLGPLLKIFLK